MPADMFFGNDQNSAQWWQSRCEDLFYVEFIMCSLEMLYLVGIGRCEKSSQYQSYDGQVLNDSFQLCLFWAENKTILEFLLIARNQK